MNDLSAPALRVTIVGAGAIGGLLAGWLARLPASRVRVSVLARGATLQQLQHRGLQVRDARDPEGQRPLQVHAASDPADLGVQDLVIVAVKGPALAGVAPAVATLLGPQTRVLVAMNGVPWWFFQGLGGECAGLPLRSVDPHGQIAACIPAAQVIGCVVHLSATTEGPAQIRHAAGQGLILGQPDGADSPVLQATAALLTQAGFAVTCSPCIQRDIWFKLWGNMTMNPLSALTGATCDRILDDPLVRGFASAVMLEAQAMGQRIGCGIDQTPDDRHAMTRKLGAFKTSMLQDVEAGRALELDALVGAVREIGQHLGLATPNIDALLGLSRLMARSRGLYPD